MIVKMATRKEAGWKKCKKVSVLWCCCLSNYIEKVLKLCVVVVTVKLFQHFTESNENKGRREGRIDFIY